MCLSDGDNSCDWGNALVISAVLTLYPFFTPVEIKSRIAQRPAFGDGAKLGDFAPTVSPRRNSRAPTTPLPSDRTADVVWNLWAGFHLRPTRGESSNG